MGRAKARPIGYAGELLVLSLGDHQVDDDAQNQRAGDGGQSDLADGHCHAADAGDQDGSNHEQILVLAQIHLLDHLQTGNSDEAVQSHANAAHNAVGDGGQEGDEGAEEGNDHAHDGSGGDGDHGSVAGNGNTADRLTVGLHAAPAQETAAGTYQLHAICLTILIFVSSLTIHVHAQELQDPDRRHGNDGRVP